MGKWSFWKKDWFVGLLVAVQGIAGSFVVKMVGSYTNIVGLPLYETVTLLGGEGFPVRFGWLNAS